MPTDCTNIRLHCSQNVDAAEVLYSSIEEDLEKFESSLGFSNHERHEQAQFGLKEDEESDWRLRFALRSGLANAEKESSSQNESSLSVRKGTSNGLNNFLFSGLPKHVSDTLALNSTSALVCFRKDCTKTKHVSSRSTSQKKSTMSSLQHRNNGWINNSSPGKELQVTGSFSEIAFVCLEEHEGRTQMSKELFHECHSDSTKQNLFDVKLRKRDTPKDFYRLKREKFQCVTGSILQSVPEENESLQYLEADYSTKSSRYEYSRLRTSPHVLRILNQQCASDNLGTSECMNSSVSKSSDVEEIAYRPNKKQRLGRFGKEVGSNKRRNCKVLSPTSVDKARSKKLTESAHKLCDMQQFDNDSLYCQKLGRPTKQRSNNNILAGGDVASRSSDNKQKKVPKSSQRNITTGKYMLESSDLCIEEHTTESVGSIIPPDSKVLNCDIMEGVRNRNNTVLASQAWPKENGLSRVSWQKHKLKSVAIDVASFLDITNDFLSDFREQQARCFSCKGSLSSEEMVQCIHKDCQNTYHRACVAQIKGSVWHRNGELVCPQHVCIACKTNHKARLWKCQRCPIAVHRNCSPWPNEMIFFNEKRGLAICWQHDSNWKQENQYRQPTNKIQEAFRRLPLPYAPQDFRISTKFWKEVMENDTEPPPYAPIRRNIFLIRKKRDDFDDGVGCTCDSTGSRCGDDCECRVQSMSCSRSCKCERVCTNKPFRKEKHVKVVKTVLCGWGAEACEAIKKGDFIIEYVGEVINDAMCEKRLWAMKGRSIRNFYMCEIGKDFIIDATFKGNPSRYLNHSCEPNCKLEKWRVDGETRVGIFALRDVQVGEPLTYDYKYIEFGPNEKCCCGSSRCRGALGEKFFGKTKYLGAMATWGEKQRRTPGHPKDEAMNLYLLRKRANEQA